MSPTTLAGAYEQRMLERVLGELHGRRRRVAPLLRRPFDRIESVTAADRPPQGRLLRDAADIVAEPERRAPKRRLWPCRSSASARRFDARAPLRFGAAGAPEGPPQ